MLLFYLHVYVTLIHSVFAVNFRIPIPELLCFSRVYELIIIIHVSDRHCFVAHTVIAFFSAFRLILLEVRYKLDLLIHSFG